MGLAPQYLYGHPQLLDGINIRSVLNWICRTRYVRLRRCEASRSRTTPSCQGRPTPSRYRSFEDYATVLKDTGQIDKDQYGQFLLRVAKLLPKLDEANTLTHDVRPEDNLVFTLDVCPPRKAACESLRGRVAILL